MNMQFKSKFLQHLAKKKSNKGFTLIELLVVVIIIGVLAAIALPNLLGQVAKGRQAEAKNNLGAINRAQQSYRLEKATFGLVGDLPVQIQETYYTFGGGTRDVNGAAHTAVAKPKYNNDIRDYASAVGQQTDGTFSAVVCETGKPDDTGVTATAGAAGAKASCPANTLVD